MKNSIIFTIFCIFQSFIWIYSYDFDTSNKTTSEKIRLKISNGEIEGFMQKGDSNDESAVFLGIPYAEPPIGPLRFNRPIRKGVWNGTLPCNDYKAACPQNITISQHSYQSEDCLYLNVFVANECLNRTNMAPCPILYLVHGGANEFETPSIYPVEDLVNNFVSKRIMLVTITYRLGILGFWSTGTEEAIGNWALEDILEGARWIQRESKAFGGDPSKVTILGYSSSSTLISLLTMSKKSAGLLHQAIIMSGTGENGQLLSNDVSYYWQLANMVGCGAYPASIADTVNCMRKIPANVLVNLFNEIRGYKGGFKLPQNVTLPRNDGPDGILPLPLEQMRSNRRRLPTIIGTTNNENGLNKLKLLNATAHTVKETCESIISKSTFVKKRKITAACIQEYVRRAEPPGSKLRFPFWTEQTTVLTEDYEYFSLCALEALTIAKTGAPVFLYSFDYEKVGLEGMSTWHAMDIGYIAGAYKQSMDSRDLQIKAKYLKLFINFIKKSNPTPNRVDGVIWRPLRNKMSNYSNLPYLSIDLPLKMKSGYHKNGAVFWNVKVPSIERDEKPGTLIRRANFGRNWNKKHPTMRLVGLFYAFITLVIVLSTVAMLTSLTNGRYAYERIY